MRIFSYLDNFFEERVGGIINFHKYNFVLGGYRTVTYRKNAKQIILKHKKSLRFQAAIS